MLQCKIIVIITNDEKMLVLAFICSMNYNKYKLKYTLCKLKMIWYGT